MKAGFVGILASSVMRAWLKSYMSGRTIKGGTLYRIVLLVVVPTMAHATDYEGSYYCKAVASGGVKAVNGGWEGVQLNTKSQDFVLKIGVPDFTDFEDLKKAAGDRDLYRVDVVETVGKAEIFTSCGQASLGPELQYLSEISDGNGLTCEAEGARTVRVRFDTLRYIDTYEAGFIDGNDNSGVTPSITIGSCTKIP